MTIADISIASSLTMPTLLNVNYDEYPKINNWLQRVQMLPEWKVVDKKFAELRASGTFRRVAPYKTLINFLHKTNSHEKITRVSRFIF